MIEFNQRSSIIIYINYFIAIFIFKQITFDNINTNKFNL